MPDYAADGTMSPQAAEPGAQEKPVTGEHEAKDPLVECPVCGAEVLLREASHAVDEPSRGLACPSCGSVVIEAD